MKKVLAIALVLALFSVPAFTQSMEKGIWDFSALDFTMPFESTGFDEVGFGAGLAYETNLGQDLLARAGMSFFMDMGGYYLMGLYAEAGLSILTDSVHGRAEWSAIGEDAYYTYSYTGTAGANFMTTIDAGLRLISMWGDYGSNCFNAYALVGPRYFNVYNTIIAPLESVALYAYGVSGYASGYFDDYWGTPSVTGGHIYFGAIVGARWWMFGLELRFMDSQFQFKFNTLIPFSWMPE